jgi:hypothetical protein
MKGKNYYGIGDDEYNSYRTEDNGKTWSTTGVSRCPGEKVYDRIIYGSTNNGGLTYSDDGGTTIVQSDRTAGNWGSIVYTTAEEATEANHGFIVYASSLDKDLVVYTEDLGETWKDLAGAASGNQVKVIDGAVYIYGNGPVTKIEGTTATVIAQNAIPVDGGLISEDIPAEPKIEGVLKVILNKLFLPILAKRFTGMKYEDFCDMVPDITLGNISYTKAVFGNSMEEDDIDYEYYCNMSPFSYSLRDIIGTEVSENTQLVYYSSIDDELEKNTVLQEMFDSIDRIMDMKKNITLTTAVDSIYKAGQVDLSPLAEIDQSSEEYSNAVDYANMLIKVSKTATASMIGTIINKIYTLDNLRRMTILKAAIFETLKEAAGAISQKLVSIKKKISTDIFYVSEGDFDGIELKFGKGLNEALDNYIKAIASLISFDADSGQTGRQYEIITAAETYKAHKGEWTDYIVNNIKLPDVKYETLNPYIDDLNEFKDKINNISTKYYEDKETCMNAYYNYKLPPAGSTEADIEEYRQTFESFAGEEFYNFCLTITNPSQIQDFEDYRNNQSSERDALAIKKKEEELYNTYDFKYRQDTNILTDFCHNIKEGLKDAIRETHKGLTPDNVPLYLSEENFSTLDIVNEEGSEISLKNILSNYTKMFNKYKERTLELQDFVVENFLKNSNTDDITLAQVYTKDLIARQDKAIKAWLLDPTSDIDAITDFIQGKGKSLQNAFWYGFKNSKEVI